MDRRLKKKKKKTFGKTEKYDWLNVFYFFYHFVPIKVVMLLTHRGYRKRERERQDKELPS